MRWRLRDGFRLGTPINSVSIISICSVRPRQTTTLRLQVHDSIGRVRLAALAASRGTQVHTTDVAETRGQYLRAHTASSPRNRCWSTPCLRLPTAKGRTIHPIPAGVQMPSNSAHTRRPESEEAPLDQYASLVSLHEQIMLQR